MRPCFKTIGLVLLALFLLPVAIRALVHTFLEQHPRSWRDADWSSAGILPPAAADPEERVLIFAGHTGGWRGIFAVHTWIVLKPEGARRYTRYDVTGFGGPLHVNRWPPDGRWFGDQPAIVADIRGPMASAAIPKIEAAVAAYDYAKPGDYRLWPGPNSNTFVATVLRSVPELAIAMPAQAIGKDFRADGAFFGLTASGTGIEAGLWGMLGAKLGWVEGLELNFLGLVAGLDWRQPALKLPGFGRIALMPVDTAQATGRSFR